MERHDRRGAGPSPPAVRCPQCGPSSSRDARFCGVCGAQAATTEPASSPTLGAAPVLIGREIHQLLIELWPRRIVLP